MRTRSFPRIATILAVGTIAICTSISRSMAGDAANEPVAAVITAPVAQSTFSPVVTGFGQIEPNPAKVQTVATAHAGTIMKVFVRPGQTVGKGDAIAVIARAPASQQSYQDAQTAYQFAKSKVDRLQKLWDEKVITRDPLDQAKINLRNAQSALQALTRMGVQNSVETIKASIAGIVTGVSVSKGDRLTQDAKVATLAPGNALAVLLGIDSNVEDEVHVGMPVRLTDAFEPSTHYEGSVSAVNRVIDPKTRLVDVLVALKLPSGDPPLVGGHVRGKIVLPERRMLSVPRAAVLYDQKGAYLFVVSGGHAHRITVSPGLESGGRIAVSGALTAGMAVVVQGNYELQDGMKVKRVAHAVK
ncbi:MAG: efflux RND transporter periplasmic adaptor subunit [Rhizobiaceae bacterium]